MNWQDIQKLEQLKNRSLSAASNGELANALAPLWEALLMGAEELQKAQDPRNSPGWMDPHDAGYWDRRR